MKKNVVTVLALGLLLVQHNQEIKSNPGLSAEDKIRIEEAFRLADSVEDRIWPNWSNAPFAVMLITNDYEYLIDHPHATNNFDTLGFDTELQHLVLYRKRLFPTNLLSTFPAINDIPTIVVGQSTNTAVTSSTAWVVTLLHEHFHQYQQSQPDYFASTNALGLSGGDETGMWMLNYPFPYDSVEVDSAYAVMSQSLLNALTCSRRDRRKYLKHFLTKLTEFRRRLPADDFKYFSFQCWQEGVARYTELRVAQLASGHFTPDKMFTGLEDYRPFNEVADSIHAKILQGLAYPFLAASRRVAFYALGAGEALLLDTVRPGWKKDYLHTRFRLDTLFSE